MCCLALLDVEVLSLGKLSESGELPLGCFNEGFEFLVLVGVDTGISFLLAFLHQKYLLFELEA